MKSKLFLSLLGLILACDFLMSGCASTSTSTLYDTPNWMPDGRIICGKLVITTSQQLYGGGISESHSYVAAFYPSGTGEVNLFEGWVGDGVNVITCSPTGEVLAGIGDGQIIISDYLGHKATVPNTSNVRYLDWSPDASKLVYSDTSRDLYVINRDGSGKTKIATSAEAVAWRVGEKIVFSFADSESSKIYIIKSDGTSKEVIASVGSKPQITQNGRVIYGGYGIQVESVKIDGSNKQILFSDNSSVSFSKLSFNNLMLTGAVIGYPGIWLINVDGTAKTKIR